MINSIKALGFRWSNKDDLIDKQFTLKDKSIEQQNMVIGVYNFLETQNYKLFVKNYDFDFIGFANDLRSIEKIERGTNKLNIESLDISIDKVENGLEANLSIKLLQL
ncbi:MAG: hypothetical protein ACO29X_06465 [Arcobacteraceae bacterium]